MAKFNVDFQIQTDFHIEFGQGDDLNVNFGETNVIHETSAEIYRGPYEVEPSTANKIIMDTRSKYMTENVVVKELPRYETGNVAGGTTLYLGRSI